MDLLRIIAEAKPSNRSSVSCGGLSDGVGTQPEPVQPRADLVPRAACGRLGDRAWMSALQMNTRPGTFPAR